MNDKSAKWLATAILSVCLIVTAWLIYNVGADGYRPWEKYLDFAATGQFGDFIGGVIGTLINGAAFYFLYLTLREQRIATNEQKIATDEQRTATTNQQRAFETERLESKFFELIKMHRDNVTELTMRSVKIAELDSGYSFSVLEEEGKAVVKDIFYQVKDCYIELRLFFKRLDRIYENKHREDLEKHPFINGDKKKLALMAQIDICYSIVYYGVSAEGLITLYKIFEGRYKIKFISELLQYISLKPANYQQILVKWSKLNKRGSRSTKISISNQIFKWRREKTPLSLNALDDNDNSIEILVHEYHNKYTKYYGGHQFRLGHYFRHLYQSVKYINNQATLSYDEKYDYIKVLRAQLSNYEQAVLFLNSLSSLGRSWEFEPEIKAELAIQGRENFELITKYNLIKNLPGDTIYGIPFKLFYPNIKFEGSNTVRSTTIYK